MAHLKSVSGNEPFELVGKQPNYLLVRRQHLEISLDQKAQNDAKCSILWTRRSGWVVIDFTGYETYVDGLRVADCKQIREGNRLQLIKQEDGFAIEMTLLEMVERSVAENDPLLRPGEDGKPPICLFDLTRFAAGEAVVLCPRCNIPHHRECWIENDRRCCQCSYQDPLAEQKRKADNDRGHDRD